LTFIPKWQASFIIAIFFLIGTLSCEDPAGQIGAELLISEENISTNFTDTVTVKSSTVLLDSNVSSGNDRLLVGRYTDPVFGTTLAKSFFQITNVDSIKANENSVLDSVVINLGYKYFIGDTTKPQTITVHRVLEKIGQNTGSLTKRLLESLDSKNTYFINDKVSYDPMPLGSKTQFFARPIIKKRTSENTLDSMRSLTIRLDDNFGKELLSLGGKKAGSGLVNFKEYFKGLSLLPSENDNAAILGFEPNNTPSSVKIKPSYLGLYYHTRDQKDTLKAFFLVSFASNPSYNNRFNYIETDKSATALSKLTKPNDSIEPQGPNGEVFIQSSTGIATKIEFPSLKNLVKDGNIALNKVELLLQPKKLVESTPPTNSLNLILVDPNDKKRPLRTATGELAAIASENRQTAQIAFYNTEKNEYVFNITNYIQNVVLGKIDNNGLFITATNDFRLNRLILDKNSIKLRIHYSKLGKNK
jgi:Domain of unknown function (DUF4270)